MAEIQRLHPLRLQEHPECSGRSIGNLLQKHSSWLQQDTLGLEVRTAAQKGDQKHPRYSFEEQGLGETSSISPGEVE